MCQPTSNHEAACLGQYASGGFHASHQALHSLVHHGLQKHVGSFDIIIRLLCRCVVLPCYHGHMLVGIDEVGRGCLAGPLVAGAVVLGPRINGLRDSKLLTREQRETLALRIERKAIAYGLGWATPAEIDQLGLTTANGLAMQRALDCITCEYDEIILDGSYNYLKDNPLSKAIIKADQTVKAVSAASIIAKVARDNYMRNQAEIYPGYLFESHVGYATKAHRAALKQLGRCDLHRLSFAPVYSLEQ